MRHTRRTSPTPLTRFPRRRNALLFSAALLTALLARPADAIGEGAAANAMMAIMGPIMRGIGNAFWQLATAAARFLTWILTDFTAGVGFAGNPMVIYGWSVVRDVANWFFIIFLLISAVATILDLESLRQYHARNLVPKLLLVALLMNFSLFFVGFLINVSQVFMTLFIVDGAGNYRDIGLALANAMRLKEGSSCAQFREGDYGVDPETLFNMETEQVRALEFACYALRIAFGMGSAFVFMFLALLLIIRVIMLWILLILSPLAFVTSIVPRMRQFSQTWGKHFFDWLLFGVIAAFFLWLATHVAGYLDQAPFSSDAEATVINTNAFTSQIIRSAAWLMQYITVGLFLIMSFMFSKRMSGQGGDFAAGAIAGGLSLGAAAGAGTIAALRASRAGMWMQQRAGEAAGVIGRAPGLRRIPGAATLRQYAETPTRQAETRADDIMKQYTDPRNLATAYKTAPSPVKAALFSRLVEKNPTLAAEVVGEGYIVSEGKRRIRNSQAYLQAWENALRYRPMDHTIPSHIAVNIDYANDEEARRRFGPDQWHQAMSRMTDEIAERNAEVLLTNPSARQWMSRYGNEHQWRGLIRGAQRIPGGTARDGTPIASGFERLNALLLEFADTVRRNIQLMNYLRSMPGRRALDEETRRTLTIE